MSFERIEPGSPEWSAYYANHIHRYLFAVHVLKERRPRRILDAACGVGYGARHLAGELDTDVIAIDRDGGALAIAERDFAHDKIRFLEDECATLASAVKHAPFDAITSFETLEHLKEPEAFLRAAAGVLDPDGVLVISVPNGDVASSEDWDFHERDFDAPALEEILRATGFEPRRLYGQRLTEIGRLRQQMRAEVHRLRFNPLLRLGSWIQTTIRGVAPPGPALPEQVEDFEFYPTTAAEIRSRGSEGPFVIVAVAAPRAT